MKKEVMGKIKRTTGKDEKGGSTAAREKMAKKEEKSMVKKGEKNETKKGGKY